MDSGLDGVELMEEWMYEALRDRRVIVAAMVCGPEPERSADQAARRLTPGLNAGDVLLLAALTSDFERRLGGTDGAE